MTVVVLVVLLVVIGLLVYGSARPPRVSVDVSGEQLRVHLSPLDKLLCVHGDLAFALSEVEGVAAAPSDLVPRTGLRMPGTGFPGVIRAGSFGSGNQRDFWDVRRGEQLLVVQLRPGAGYRRVVVEVSDPHAEALRLRPVVGAYAGTFER